MFCERKREMWKGSQWNRESMSIFLKFSEECAKRNGCQPIEHIRTIRNRLKNAKDYGIGTSRSLRIYGCHRRPKELKKEYWYLFEELPDVKI